ncbi:hypothetical protein Btru_047322 [Bulinus truncatus]|nr:hypothetical protein Btru_047322 [Bulinus truncatus]
MKLDPANNSTCIECGKIITATSGTIMSSYRDSSLSILVACSWTIRASKGNVVSLSSSVNVETRPAYIKIYDGSNSNAQLLAIFNGGLGYAAPNGIIRTSSNEMFITQFTGYNNGYYGYSADGFSATYWTHVNVSTCTTRNCSHVCVTLQNNGQNNERCYCPIGMQLEGDTCVACKNNTYGPDCSRDCDCVQNNTLSCDTRTGECNCLPLWKGKNCSTDSDVCSPYSKNECQKYANCSNTGAQGYRCRCSQKDGYIESANKSCVPITCKNNTYGPDCSRNCNCVQSNTLSCDTRTGECTCLPLWKGKNCSIDSDVCTQYSTNECQKYANCIYNGAQGYRCRCSQYDGYIESANKSCVPINCTYVSINSTGIVTSPLYPSYYMNNAFCTWSISVQEDYVISFSPGVEKCACPDDFILDTVTETVCVVPYYPNGKNATDQLLSDNYTSYNTIFVSPPVYFSYGALYGYDIHPAAFISSNGVITLGGYHNLIFKTDQQINILAPFMANINPYTGQVFYHLYEKGAVKLSSRDSYRSSEMDAIIARAEKDIKEYNHISDFEVSTVLVVTWAGVQPYGSTTPSDQNTFQALYINGFEPDNGRVAETAYAIFLYQHGLMNWSYLPGRPISIGTSGDFTNVLQDLDTTLVSVLDSVPGNTGYKGVMSFKVGHLTGPKPSCKKNLYDYASLLSDPMYQYEKEQLYKCPCSLERLGTQWQLFERRGLNQDIYCYAISMVAKQRLLRDNKRNMLCCYQWIKPSSDNWREWLQS